MKYPENENDEAMLRAFDVLLKPVRKKMHVNTFTKKFLPFLGVDPIDKKDVVKMLEVMGRRTNANHTPEDLHINLMNEWMNEVGSPFVEVEVFNQDGEILYVIPPILDNSTEIANNKDSIPNLVEQASNQARIFPRLGEEYINKRIIPLLNHATMKPEYVKMWNKVFAYHQMPLIKIASEQNTTDEQPTAPTQDSNKVDSFDDFGD